VSTGKYKLEGRNVVPVQDLLEWGNWFEKADRHVGLTEIGEEIRVSTVFLGIDHNFGVARDPVLFETMVFGGPLDGEQERYCTYDEAEKGHAVMVDRVREAMKA
jgi:hypothetical protein